MQLKIYSSLFLFFIFIDLSAQELFTKKELYHVWITAGEDLSAGKFDDALSLYNAYPENPSFNLKIKQATRLKEIYADGNKLLRPRKYAEAIEKFKEYRKLKDIGSLAIFERKIEDCLTNINKGKTSDLTSQQRIITGFEFAHKGREKLSTMDTTAARILFNNAKNLGGNRNSILKDQYSNGIIKTTELTKWAKKHLGKKNDGASKEQELADLESYRNMGDIYIPELEIRIRSLKTDISGKNNLQDIANLCDTELLINYVNTNKSTISTSQYLLSRLNEFLSTQKKIVILKQDVMNSETVKSAYQSLITWTDDLPAEIRSEMKRCIQSEYSEYISSLPKQQTSQVEENIKEKCEGEEDFKKGVSLVRKELSSCNPIRAQYLWKTTLTYITNCYNKEILLREKKPLMDSIARLVKNDSILNDYRNQIRKLKELSECAKIEKIYHQMGQVNVCDKNQLAIEVRNGLSENKNCRKPGLWKLDITGSLARIMPKYKIGNTSMQMDNGWFKSAGLQVNYIDTKNPFDFIAGLEYFNLDYYSVGVSQSIQESFEINGANAFFHIKLHKTNYDLQRLRPYIKFGPEVMIPISYEYENYFNSSRVSSTDQLQRSIFSVSGALGLEIQKKNYGFFAEGFTNYGLGSLYNSSVSHITSTREKVDARFVKLGIRIGVRLW